MGWNEVEGKSSANEKMTYTKFGTGNTMIRIISNEPHSFWSHWLAKQKTSITCPGKGCPICSLIKAAKENKETPLYNSSQRHAVLIYNYTTKQFEVMIQGKTFFSQLLDLHKEVGDITTYDIKVIRKGDGTDTTYTLLPQPVKEFSVEGVEVPNVDLEQLFSPPTHEEILQLLEGKTWAEINGVEETA